MANCTKIAKLGLKLVQTRPLQIIIDNFERKKKHS